MSREASRKGASGGLKKHPLLHTMWKKRTCYLMAAGFLIIFTLFTVVPVLSSFGLSFTYYNLLQPPEFVGVGNYISLLLKDSLFWKAFGNTMMIAVITGPAGYLLCILIAWLISDLNRPLRMFLTLLFYAPSISGASYAIWQIILSGDANSFLNSYLINWGFIDSPIQWLSDVDYMFGCVVVVILWSSLGTGFLSFVAGFQTMDRSLYEAGAIDGIKNRFQELWFITLPYMRPQMMFGAVMSITGSFSVGAVITALLGYPSTDYAVHTISHHLEDYGGIKFDLGYASAIATVLFVLMLVSNLLVQRLLSKVGQ